MGGDWQRAFKAVLCYEIRQGLRSPAWWVLVLNFGIPVFLISASPFDPWVSFTHRVFAPIIVALAFLLVTPFVYILTLEREIIPWAHDIFWVRLPHTGGALLAKTVAGIVLVLLATIPVLTWVLAVAWFYHGWSAWQGWGQSILILLPAIFIYAALSLLVMLLIPHRFAARILSLFLMLGLLLLQDNYTLLDLWIPLTRIYFSNVTGFHPFGKLLIWHRLFWVLLSIGIIFWILGRLSQRAKRLLDVHERRWAHSMQWLGGMLVLTTLLPAFLFYQEKAKRFYEVDPYGEQTYVEINDDVCPRAYRVEVTFDLRHVQLHGRATWQGTYGTPKLQAGLRGALVQEGQQIRMEYSGSPRWPRQVIWCPECLRDLNLIFQRSLQPYPLGWYFVEGHLFLLMTGAWHPFPGCPMERLQVRLSHLPCESCIAVTGSPEQQPNVQAGDFLWEKPPGQGPLLAVAATYQSIGVNGRVFLLPRHIFSLQVQEKIATSHMVTLEQMNQNGLLTEKEAYTLAIVDKLTYPRWSQEGLILVPLEHLDVKASEPGYPQYVALSLLMGWWCQDGESCVANFADALSKWAQSNSLSVDMSMGDPERVARQLESREQNTSPDGLLVLPNLLLYAAYRLQDPVSDYQPLAIHFSGKIANPFFTEHSPIVLNFLDALYRRESAYFWHILRAYRDTYGVQDISLATFTRWLEDDLGIMPPELMPMSP